VELPALRPLGEPLAAREGREPGAERAREAARGFESLLATMIVKELRRALPEGPFGEGTAGEVYAGWFDEHLGHALAEGGGLALDERLAAELARDAARRAAELQGQGAADGALAAARREVAP
jgi:Rod binding domain-containing protein